jgi:hypothetical protein
VMIKLAISFNRFFFFFFFFFILTVLRQFLESVFRYFGGGRICFATESKCAEPFPL